MLPPLLEKFDNLKVVIAGQDRAAYSYKAPDHQGSWKQTMLSEISDSVGLDRVYFTGSLNYRDYQLLLCRTDLHVYFTRPYVTSWGLFQAAASGTHLMVNRDPATNYVLGASEAEWVNLDDPASLVETATFSLAGAQERRYVKSVSKLRDEWQLPQCLMAWSKLINQSLKHGMG
jgi:glycosyltransferase involved in cell wall biosynthesis